MLPSHARVLTVAVAVSLTVLAAPAAPASAAMPATLSAGLVEDNRLKVDAGGDHSFRITVTPQAGGGLVVEADMAITKGRGCTGSNARRLVCTGAQTITVEGSFRADTLDTSTVALPVAIFGRDGDDLITSGSGADMIEGDGGNDTIFSGSGNDEIRSASGNNTVHGGAGNDIIDLYWGHLEGGNTAFGEAGNDRITAGVYDDRLDGGTGADTISYEWHTMPVTVNLATSSGGSGDGDDDLVEAFEHIIGGRKDDVLVGNGGANRIEAGRFESRPEIPGDTLLGQGGVDVLLGGASDDYLIGGDGGDTIDGKGGVDDVDGGAGVDVLTGGDGDDTIDGGADADVVTGGIGNDTLLGGGGDDIVRGGAGDDVLAAGSLAAHAATDNDRLDGGAGTDTAHARPGTVLASCEVVRAL